MKLIFLNKILNIHPEEWYRLAIAWIVTFLTRTGVIIGSTILIATFLDRMGIHNLPFLFIINAILSMGGVLIYTEIIHRLKIERLIILICLVSGILLVASGMLNTYKWLFISIILVTQAILLTQLNIMIALFVEDIFSPLESQRLFPLVESSQTIGGIFAGFIIMLLANQIPTYKFVHIWTLTLALIIITIFIFQKYQKRLPFLKFTKKKIQKKTSIELIQENIKEVNKTPFLKGLIVVIFFQWLFVNMLEFQYTKAIHQTVTNTEEKTIVLEQLKPFNLKVSALKINGEQKNNMAKNMKTSVNHIKNYEQMLVFDLGSLQMIFNGAALIIQLFLASRLFRSLGTVNSLLINPIVNLFSLLGLTLHFSFTSAVTAKTAYEASHTLFQTAYHTTYYTLNTSTNKQTKELLEGLIKPLGTMTGMSVLLIFQIFSRGANLTTHINLLMIAAMLIVIAKLIKIQPAYTKLAKHQLMMNKENLQQRLNAIEILIQKGHKNGWDILRKILLDKHELPRIKIKILEGLAEQPDYKTLPEILDCVENENDEIKLKAIECLGKFKKLGKHVFSQAFSKYRVIITLKRLFKKESSEEIRTAIVEVLAHLNENEIAPFLITTLKSTKNKNIRADCIYLCTLFDDPNIAYYIKPYLQSRHLATKAYTIVGLWKLKKYPYHLRKIIYEMVENSLPQVQGWACYIIGEIKEKKYFNFLRNCLNTEQKSVQRQAALALAKNRNVYGEEKLAELLLDKDRKFVHKTKQNIKTLTPKVQKNIDTLLTQKASQKINQIINQNAHKSTVEEFPYAALKELEFYFKSAHAEKEAYRINELIKKQKNAVL